MDTTLSANIRPGRGKGSARKARATGVIPAVIYGPGADPVSVTVTPRSLTDIFRHSGNRNTIVELDIDGEKVPTLVRAVQRHPLTRDILHVDFYRVESDRKVEVMVPVEAFGKPKGAILGGRLRVNRRSLRTRCDFDKIPKSFRVDVSPMSIGDIVNASEIPTPDGVELVFDHDFQVLVVYGKSSAVKALEAEEAAAAAEGAEPAAGGGGDGEAGADAKAES